MDPKEYDITIEELAPAYDEMDLICVNCYRAICDVKSPNCPINAAVEKSSNMNKSWVDHIEEDN